MTLLGSPVATRRGFLHQRFCLLVLTVSCLLLGVVFVGCDSNKNSTAKTNAAGKKSIVVTSGMVRDIVRALVGDDANVYAIMGPGVDPHLYQPTRTDAVKMLEADVVVYNGLHLEGRLGEILKQRQTRDGATIAVGDLLPVDQLIDADAGTHDPHIWMDVRMWADATLLTADKMASAMPEHADAIRERGQAYHDELIALDKWGADAIGSIPESQRILVTAHDAFNYFSRRYDIKVFAPQGISTASEPSISDISEIVNIVVNEKVPAIFLETSVSPRAVNSIIEGAKQKGVELSHDHELYSDSLGADDSPQGTYIGVMRHNFGEIATALGGTIPEEDSSEKVPEEHSSEKVADEPPGELVLEPSK